MTLKEKFQSFSKDNLSPVPHYKGIAIRFDGILPKEFSAADKVVLKLNFDISNPEKQPMSNLNFLGTSDDVEYYSLDLTNPHLYDFSKTECIFHLENGKFIQFTFNETLEKLTYAFETLVYYGQPPQDTL